MLNPNPVAARTRSRTEAQLRNRSYEIKRRKIQVFSSEEESEIMSEPPSLKKTDKVQNFVEEKAPPDEVICLSADSEEDGDANDDDSATSTSEANDESEQEEERKATPLSEPSSRKETNQDEKNPDVICLSADSDSEEADDESSSEVSDDPVTSTSGEDNDESDDLDYYYEKEKDLQGSVFSESEEEAEDIKALFSETSSHAKGKAVKVEFVSADEEDVIKLTPSRKRGRPASSSSSKKVQLLQVLTNTILDEEEEEEEEDSDTSKIEEPPTEVSFPLRNVTFRGREKIIPEKTEEEKEMDQLWAEMQFYLYSSQIGSTEPPMVEKEDADVPEVIHDRATLCSEGKHELRLDEEVGMVCKYCSCVTLEIKYISAPLIKPSCGKYQGQYYGSMESDIFDGFQYEDSDNDMPVRDPFANIEGTVWEIIPDLKNKLYPHQREAFEFIWTNIAGGIYRDKSKNPSEGGGGGCIISHAPGTGKTLLSIVFLQTYLKEYPGCRPVIVAPRSMLLTWEAEFRKWKVDIPFHNVNSLDFSGKEKTKGIGLYEKFKLCVLPSDRALAIRLVKLLSWKSDGGILGISYRLFEQLAGKDDKGKRKCTMVYKNVSRILLELPGLFVFDEGHTPRNDGSLMWKALTRIKTERRIILSGTPFQNNFDELFNTLCLVRPKFAEGIQFRHGGKVNKKNSCKGSEARWKWASLTGTIGKELDKNEAEKVREIRDVIKPFVHVHKGSILQSTLPGLRHSVVVLQPSNLQMKILDRVKETKNMMFLDYYVSLISVHPSLGQQLSDHNNIKESLSSIISTDKLERIRLKTDEGVKTKFLMELIKLSRALEEKVIVFSQYIEPLNLIMEQLKDFFRWTEGKEILYMHGKCDFKQRQCVINDFNNPTSEATVLLASTKACSEGIHLVGGSRVVLLDVAWNPSVERQAVSRAYRLGQKKVVYTYHLISSGTLEGVKCCRQAGKDRLSELLFSSSGKGDDHLKKVSNVQEDKILEDMLQNEKLKPMFEKIINQPKDSDLILTYEDL